MNAVVVKNPAGLNNLTLDHREVPEPQMGEVLVRWHATSLNYHDYLIAIGAIPVEDGRIPMSDGAGEIMGLGPDVDQWKVGDPVMGMFFPKWIDGVPTLSKTRLISGETVDGFMTEASCVDAAALTRVPQGYSYGQAATLPCAGLTAWRALFTEGNIKAGESVLIEGTGGMSIFGLQFARMAGAKVFATTSSEEKAEKLISMGVEGIADYKKDPKWGKRIFKLSDGGVDHVLDIGGGSTMKQSIEAAKIGGRITAIGILSNGRKGEITFPKMFFKHLTMKGIAVDCRASQELMVKAINEKGLQPNIDKRFAFDQLPDAFRYQAEGTHFGKIVLEW